MDVVIGPVSSSERRSAARLLAQAFRGDPVVERMAPGVGPRRLRILFELEVEEMVAGSGRVDVAKLAAPSGPGEGEASSGASPIVGVAVWEGPHRRDARRGRGAWRRALRGLFMVGPLPMRRLARTTAELQIHRPTSPHWYLSDLVVAEEGRGRGVGSRLLDVGLRRADESNLPSYLEATTEGSRRLYERHGFRGIGAMPAYAETQAVAMLRPLAQG